MRVGLAMLVGRRQDLMKVRSCLKAAKDVHWGGFDWIVLCRNIRVLVTTCVQPTRNVYALTTEHRSYAGLQTESLWQL